MEKHLTQEITDKIADVVDAIINEEYRGDALTELVTAILSQVDTMIEARMQSHIFASHTALADSNKE